jgi:hypothetical protein
MPRSKALRDIDLLLEKTAGCITEKQVKAEVLRRDMKDLRKEPFYLSLFLFLLSILGVQFGISVYILGGLCVYPLLSSVYSAGVKVAEMKTEIVYLEAGIELTRR